MDSDKSSDRPPPPPYPERSTVALFGQKPQFKNIIGNLIFGSENAFLTASNSFVVGENYSFKVVTTPDLCDEEGPHPDQDIIDFMAISYPGPHLFILAIDSENAEEEQVKAQISKLQQTFGENISEHLVLVFQDKESTHSLSHLKEHFYVWSANKNLATNCRKLCSGHQSFVFDYKNYSQDVVMRRKETFDKRRRNGQPLYDHGEAGVDSLSPSPPQQALAAAPGATVGRHNGADPTSPSTSQQALAASRATVEHHIGGSVSGVQNNIFNIVLLGLSGTGKSASANTILMAGNPQIHSHQLFKSQSSSMPVTTQVECNIMKKFGVEVRVVDTPDFFNDQLENSQAHIEKCKKYCQPGQCVVLLVIQLGRFTDGEKGILEKLEEKLGWEIRDSTIVLLTHGDEQTESLRYFIEAHDQLKHIVELCSGRHHLFNNSTKDSKQVMELIQKIPNHQQVFPKFHPKNAKISQCCVC